MPTSVMYAVPRRIVSSAVWTCVWVPIAAAARPAACQPSTFFSLVASAWRSMITGWSVPTRSNRSSIARNGSSSGSMNTLPITWATVILSPPGSANVAAPSPGVPGG